MYINSFTLVSFGMEDNFISGLRSACLGGIYPFNIFPQKELHSIEFAPVTVFYGSNGSGKTTLLNVIGEKLGIKRHAAFGSSEYFSDYVQMCTAEHRPIPEGSEILTSDDVSDYLLDMRRLNSAVDTRREELYADYAARRKPSRNRLSSLADYEQWKESYDARSLSRAKFVGARLEDNVKMCSNGQTAMKYYIESIGENHLYLIDEPENSLSAKLQLELQAYIYDSARYFGCQFIIATHSPFFLAIPNAKIYDLDSSPCAVRKWTELENVQVYRKFFADREQEFIQ